MAQDNNKIIHGLWIGTQLSRLELLTLKSFVHWGHEFHLWIYDELETPVPVGVRLRDATQILPRSRIFRTSGYDAETGVGRNALPPFSDLFRYKLLYEYGGIWADMDITCLRQFDFREEYVFRAHRIGMVGNLMKCPPGSQLMLDTYTEADAVANERVEWLALNRLLNKNVERLGLAHYIRHDISNMDSWKDSIAPLVERYTPIPDKWYAIHWANEFWRTLNEDQGHYRGRKLLDYIPDKENPFPGSTLHELYRFHHLLNPWAETPAPTRPRPTPPKDYDVAPDTPPGHIAMLLPALARGGAERLVVEIVDALRARADGTATIYVMGHCQQQYALATGSGVEVVYLNGDWSEKGLRKVALKVLMSLTPVLYTHLIQVRHLQTLWRLGVTTVPVVHNARPGWLDAPTAYASPRVPFVLAVADAVAVQLRESDCPQPVITLRHELQRRFVPDQLARARAEIRDRHGVGDDTLLIGMVGQFKSQKAYTRAVRVLAALRQTYKARLMILGGWDHEYGSGRTTYEATCRLALDLGVMADLIMPGNVHPVEPYFGAFDVYLNTSVYEGLSIALLEAIQAGCPVVTADAGGNREVLPAHAVLVEQTADSDAYVQGTLRFVSGQKRQLPAPLTDPDLIPQLWRLLAKYGIASSTAQPGAPAGTLFITESLHLGGPARSIVNLLSHLPAHCKTALCVLGGISVDKFLEALMQAQVPLLSLHSVTGLPALVEKIILWAERLNVRTICFWNARPEIKLLLTKILALRAVRLIDVSPGPMLFDELTAAAPFQRRICLTQDEYLRRLDLFVALYRQGILAGPAQSRQTVVIPLGVVLPPRFVPLPQAACLLPEAFNPELAVGTCCRIVPDKRIEFLFDMMAGLRELVPGVSLTIVGGADSASVAYRDRLLQRLKDECISDIYLVGPHEDVNPFLAQFRVFVMVSDRQGCPNASLEAMAMCLPVVANPDGGTAEQIEDGVNGFLVTTAEAMANAVTRLLRDPALRRRLGEAGYRRARDIFSMDRMVQRYEKILEAEDLADALQPAPASSPSSPNAVPIAKRELDEARAEQE